MTTKIPLVLNNGQIEQLQSGDSLPIATESVQGEMSAEDKIVLDNAPTKSDVIIWSLVFGD
jgi:hypothetical protein